MTDDRTTAGALPVDPALDARLFWAEAEALLAAGDADGVVAACEARLRGTPRELTANLAKAEALFALGRIRGAVSFYRAAFQLAGEQLAGQAHARAALERAQHTLQDAGRLFTERLENAVAEAGLDDRPEHLRFRAAIDMMLGRIARPETEDRYPNRPTVFFMPGLPTTEFAEPGVFPWEEHLRRHIDEIDAELDALLDERDLFEPYLRNNPVAPVVVEHDAYGNAGWGAMHLHSSGTPNEEILGRCPRTMEILGALPVPTVSGKSPNILFSRLRPGMHIPPHHGQMNTRFVGHLPLRTPKDNWIRVGSQTRHHRRGEILLFDDTIEHEARNESDEDRIVLIFDVWRPELNEDEKRMITALFDAVEAME